MPEVFTVHEHHRVFLLFYVAEFTCVPAVLHRLIVFPHSDSHETLSEFNFSRLPVPSPFIVQSPSIARS